MHKGRHFGADASQELCEPLKHKHWVKHAGQTPTQKGMTTQRVCLRACTSYCAMLHMEISVPKIKVVIVLPAPVSAADCSCHGNLVEQVSTFKYLGLHFHRSTRFSQGLVVLGLLFSGDILCCSAVTLSFCLGACFAARCQVWGMHSPRVAAANHAPSKLHRLHDYCLRTVCDLLPSTPRKMLLGELGLLPLQVVWWQQTLQFWNSLAALPVDSFYHTVCLDNLADAFGGGACNTASSLAGCLHLVGYSMLRVCDVIPISDNRVNRTP